MFLLLLLSIYVTIGKLRAQSVPEDNLYLLVHPNFHEIYLNLKMSQGQSYLSLIEVLQLFEIPFSVGKDSAGNMTTVSGGPQQISDWKIDFRNSIVYMKAKNKPLNSDDFLPDGRDLYLKIEWFDSLFEVRWAQNEASMALSFESSRELPFQCRLRREYARRQLPLGSGAAALIVDSTLERKRRMFGVGRWITAIRLTIQRLDEILRCVCRLGSNYWAVTSPVAWLFSSCAMSLMWVNN